MGIYADAARELMGAAPEPQAPAPTHPAPGAYKAAAQQLLAQPPQPPPETPSQRIHRNLLGDRSPRPQTAAGINQQTQARLQQIQQKPVYAPALMGQPLQSDPTTATEMWNRPDLTPTEQGAAYFGSAVSKGIPFFRHPARRNYGGEVQTDFGDSALANVAEAGTELGVGLGVNIGEQMLGARVAGMPGMLGSAGLSTASDAALAEQQKRVQRKEAPGTLGEDVSRGVGITMSGPDDTNLARGMRAASVPITMASTMLGVKMSRNVAALAKSAGGVTPEVIRRAALASFGGGATSVAETMVQKAGQGDTDFTNPAYWADPALSFFVGAAADAIGAKGDVSDGLTQRAIADLKPTVDPNVRPEATTGIPPESNLATDIPPEYNQNATELGTDLPPTPRPEVLPTEQPPIQQAAVNTPEEPSLVEGTPTQASPAQPESPSDKFLKRLGVAPPEREVPAAEQAVLQPEPAAVEPQQPVAQPVAAAPPPEPPAPKIPVSRGDGDVPENDATFVRQALEERGRKYGFNPLEGVDDDPKKVAEVFEQAAREGFGEEGKVRDVAARIYEQIDKGEEPTLTPKEVAGFSMRVEQLDNKIKRLEKFVANKMTPEPDRQLFQNEIDQAVEEMAFIAPARIQGGKTASFSMNMLRAYRKADDGGIGVLNRKVVRMEKDAAAKGRTIVPEKIKAVKEQIQKTEQVVKDTNKEIVRLGEERSNLAAEEAAAKLPNEKGRPSNSEETMAKVERILKSNNGCKTFYGM